jgi:hypothetical protein
MERDLIIQNDTDLPMIEILPYVKVVLQMGRISGSGTQDQYCYLTTFREGIVVFALLEGKSDRLIVRRENWSNL